MEPEKKADGAFIGIIIIIIILIVGGIYIWQSNKNKILQEKSATVGVTSEDVGQLDTLEQELQTANIETGVDTATIK